jgi:acetyltransferase-like isoleucine patch superfamily enzyme
VLDGVRIGSDVVVGANAVVNTDLPDGAVAAGVPARVLRSRADPGGAAPG